MGALHCRVFLLPACPAGWVYLITYWMTDDGEFREGLINGKVWDGVMLERKGGNIRSRPDVYITHKLHDGLRIGLWVEPPDGRSFNTKSLGCIGARAQILMGDSVHLAGSLISYLWS